MIQEKLCAIQRNLKAPKGQFNKFGGYKYRSCEDILEAVKPLLGDCSITIMDDIVMVGDRIYVKAIATLSDGESSISTQAFARESEDKKGMDSSQITGSASSYARKYALNGLLLIDDTKDADTQDNRTVNEKAPNASHIKQYVDQMRNAKDIKDLGGIWNQVNAIFKKDKTALSTLLNVKEEMKAQLSHLKEVAND